MATQDTYQPTTGAPPAQAAYQPSPKARKAMQAAAPLLPPGTQIRQAFIAETRSPWLFIAMALPLAVIGAALVFIAINRNRIIAVTDDGIYVLDCGAMGVKHPKRVLAVLPRATRFGQLVGTFPKIQVGAETLYVARAFVPDVAAADYQAAFVTPGTRTIDLTVPAPAPAPVPVVSGGKSKTTAGLLAILLGSFGAHKFYLGQMGIGIVYLLLCWTFIPGLLGVVEGIIFLTRPDDQFQQRYGSPEVARHRPFF